jgi:hypothetical protein
LYVKFKQNCPLQPLAVTYQVWDWYVVLGMSWLIGMLSAHHCNKMFELVPSVVVCQNGKNFSTCQLTHFYWFIYAVEEQKRMLTH